MINQFLLLVYLYIPSRFKKFILNKIIRNEGGQMYSSTLRSVFKEKYGIQIGYGTYGGCFSTSNNIPANVSFGNYCSIAPNLRIFRANHPIGNFTTHPLLYNPIAGYVSHDLLDRPHLSIGNDVWIGELAIILPNVKKIGNGAIIGAGTILTKDVEPYSIVVGNPGRCIGKRFDDKVIRQIEETKWWDMSKDELISHIELLKNIGLNAENN